MRRPRSYEVRVAYAKPLKLLWWRGSDKLPDPDEPRIERTTVRFTKRKARGGAMRIVITGKPAAIRAIAYAKDFDQRITVALLLGASRG